MLHSGWFDPPEWSSTVDYQGETMRTTCEYCSELLTLDIIDSDGVLIGAECICGEYVTRYMSGQSPDSED